MKLREYHEKLRPFVFHGVDLDNDDKESQGTCPFCHKLGHFGVMTDSGKWRCVRCDTSGNIYGFLKALYQQALDFTNKSPDVLTPLSEERGISIRALRKFGIASTEMGQYLVPSHNTKSILANLSKIIPRDGGGWTIMSTPGCNQWPFGTLKNPPVGGPIWLMEGLWDACKMFEVLSSVGIKGSKYVLSPPKRSLASQCDVLGIPGCKTFHKRFLDLFKDRDLQVVYDSDHPDPNHNGAVDGHDGMQKILEIIHEEGSYPLSLKFVSWGKDGYDPDLPDGYDARDMFNSMGPCKGLAHLDSIMSSRDLNPPANNYHTSTDKKEVEIVPCNNFQDLLEAYREQKLRVTRAFEDTLAVMFAVSLSVTAPGDQLWFRVIGPPGCGKSTMAMAFCGSDHCAELSKFTGFHSGYVGTSGERKKGDASLIPQLHNKMVWNKDADTIMTSPNRDGILGETRELYDGESTAHYRNRKHASYAGHRMAFVWCGTDTLRGLNRTSLGERFLDCDIFLDSDQEPYLKAAHSRTKSAVTDYLTGAQQSAPQTVSEALKPITAGFIDYLWNRIGNYPAPIYSQQASDSIRAMGELLSYIRATIDRQGRDMAYRPRRELGTRIVSQFTKLASCLACMLDHPTVDEAILRIVRKVMKDSSKSCGGFRLEILQHLYKVQEGLTLDMLESRLRLPATTIWRSLRDMQELGIVERVAEPNRSGIRGRKNHYLRLTDTIRGYYHTALVKVDK